MADNTPAASRSADTATHRVLNGEITNSEKWFVTEEIQKMNAEMRALKVDNNSLYRGRYWQRVQYRVMRAFHKKGIIYRPYMPDDGIQQILRLIFPERAHLMHSDGLVFPAPPGREASLEGATQRVPGELPPLKTFKYPDDGAIFAKPTTAEDWTVYEDLYLVWCENWFITPGFGWGKVEQMFDEKLREQKIFPPKQTDYDHPIRGRDELEARFDKLYRTKDESAQIREQIREDRLRWYDYLNQGKPVKESGHGHETCVKDSIEHREKFFPLQ